MRGIAVGRHHDVEARGTPAVEPQAENPLANLTRAETLTVEPARGNIAHELTRQVRLNVRPHGVKRHLPMRGVGVSGHDWTGQNSWSVAGLEDWAELACTAERLRRR